MHTVSFRRSRRTWRPVWPLDRAAVVGLFWAFLAFVLLGSWPGSYEPEPYVRLPLVGPGCVNLPEKEVITISADADGRLYFAHSDRVMQTEIIRRVAAQQGVALAGPPLTELSQLPFLGLDTHYLPAYLKIPAYERRQVRLPGISNGSIHSELAKYIVTGRAVNLEKANRYPYLALRADSALHTQTIKQVIRTFQRQGIHRFYLLNQSY